MNATTLSLVLFLCFGFNHGAPSANQNVTKTIVHTCGTQPIATEKNYRRNAKRWPNAIVPVLIEDGEFDNNELQIIGAGLRAVQSQTCIRFVDYDPQVHRNYIRVTSNNQENCQSFEIGMRGGEQFLTLGHGDNCIHQGVVAHEFIHALGFWHEHVRYDRDKYVNVIWDNIQEDKKDNFELRTRNEADTFNIQYDMNSIMHYVAYMFPIDNTRPTLVSKVRGQKVNVNHPTELTASDAKKINIAYKCR